MTVKSGDIPKFDQLMIPTLNALKMLGGSASNDELFDAVMAQMGLPEEIKEYTDPARNTPELSYRMAWARTYLKGYGAITNSERGVWSLTDKGEKVQSGDVEQIKREVRAVGLARRRANRAANNADVSQTETNDAIEEQILWSDKLTNILLSMEPSAFERLCQRLLRESGFTKVDVTGKSGDGGIDGIGVLRINLISFHVLFQAKRWKNSVGSEVVGNFRGAMQGRSDKGLIITTGTFTAEARKEAARDGAPAIDLVEGEMLCKQLKELKLGVKVRLIEEIEVDADFFTTL